MIINDDGEYYELKHVNDILSISKTERKPSKETLLSYIETYELAGNPKKLLTIQLKNDELIAKLPGQGPLKFVFLTDTTIRFESILDIQGELLNKMERLQNLL